MKGKTKTLVGQVREALLALPDDLLVQTLSEWLDGDVDQVADGDDEFYLALGYRVQSDKTHTSYASFEELEREEPDGEGCSWMAPDAQALRAALGALAAGEFYHSVIGLAGETTALEDAAEEWGDPPSPAGDGYAFMRGLVTHLRALPLRHQAGQGHVSITPPPQGRRRPMKA